MNDIKRIRLSGLQLFTHYALPLLILTAPILSLVSIIQILTDNYDGIRTIDEHMSTSIPFLIIGLLLIYRQYRRLNFKVFTIDHSDRDFQHAIGKTGMELKWRTERNRDGYYRAYRLGMDGPWWWGEMITIIRENNRIYINSVSDPNQSPTPSSFGWDRKNVRTFIRNLQTIVTENNERTNRPTANTGISMFQTSED